MAKNRHNTNFHFAKTTKPLDKYLGVVYELKDTFARFMFSISNPSNNLTKFTINHKEAFFNDLL